jgi:hypothetical protein
MKCTGSKFIMLLVFAVCSFAPSSADSQITKITPSQPYAIWININQALIDLSTLKVSDVEVYKQIEEVGLESFSGKKPDDVYILVGEFRQGFSVYSGRDLTTHGDNISELEETIIYTLRTANNEIIPAMVFSRSVLVLDLIMQSYIELDSSARLLSPYYKLGQYDDKNPSDVYALVDLASKRLQILINAEGGK